jgi:pimeloyl-ACP methyl ester carboxylesterase
MDEVKRIEVNGISIFCRVIGQGYPLGMMHGGPGSDHASLLPLKGLSDSFTLIYYDHRCNGRSTGPEVDTMNWGNLTADAEALRKNLGIEKWGLLGHSFGGMVALEYALRYPTSLSHMILLGSGASAFWPQENAPELLGRRGYGKRTVEASRRYFAGEVSPPELFRTKLRIMPAYHYRFNPFRVIFKKRSKGNSQAFIYGFSTLLKGWNITDRLHEIQTPTLVLAGRHDFIFPPEHQALIADRLPNARLEIIERAGHTAGERPKEIIRLVKNFVSSVKPG